MKPGIAALGFLGLVGVALLVIRGTFRSMDGDLIARQQRDRDRLVPVPDDEPCAGVYRWSYEEILLRVDGGYAESGFVADYDLMLPVEGTGAWSRSGSSIILLPGVPERSLEQVVKTKYGPGSRRELSFGRLDGVLALVGEYRTWRRVP